MDNIKKFEGFLDRMQELLDNAKKQGHILVRVEDLENAFPEFMESEDKNKPNGGIVMEDFNEGNGFYKVNLAYLNEEQVKEIEELIKKWNLELKESEDEKVRKEIVEYLKKNLRLEWATWLEKQGKQKPFDYEHANIQQKDFAPKDSYAIKENGSPYPTKSAVVFGAKNPTWSKKDEMNLEDSMRAIKCSNYFDFESAKENVLNWLKSLKERIGG